MFISSLYFPSHLSTRRKWQISKDKSEHPRRLEAEPKSTTTVKACQRKLLLLRISEHPLVLKRVLRREKTECKKSEGCRHVVGISTSISFPDGKFCSL